MQIFRVEKGIRGIFGNEDARQRCALLWLGLGQSAEGLYQSQFSCVMAANSLRNTYSSYPRPRELDFDSLCVGWCVNLDILLAVGIRLFQGCSKPQTVVVLSVAKYLRY